VFRGARVLTCDEEHRVLDADVAIEGDRIVAIGEDLPGDTTVDVRGRWLVPGFVQTHIHLVQTLFRGLADDLALLDWLRTRIWPLERAHDEDSTYASARLGVSELLAGGTTAILDMATVHHTDSVFRAAEEAGIRLWCGKAQMDRDNEAGLSEPTDRSMQSACDLADRWHGRGLLRYAFAPRFVPSCSDELLRQTATEARRRGCMVHTHASENRGEVELVRALTGRDNVVHLDALGLSGPDIALAHCIHLTDEELRLLARTGTRVLHCPSSNFKLGSGHAPIPELLAAGAHVSIGADGAPCNNRLDMFAEMRLAALMQKPRLDPTAMPAPLVLRMATANGAEALGFPGGRIAPGCVADLVVIDPNVVWGGGDPRSAMVYTLDARAVRQTWVAGRKVAEDGRVIAWDRDETTRLCRDGLSRVARRAGIAA
jgi:cytosine/adenosine deaminase-related metal-dependent hydrolase